VYEGYVQDDCGSPQIPWTAIVFPEGSDCLEYEWCCTHSSVFSIDIDTAGTEYTAGDALVFIGGNPVTPAVGTVLTVDVVTGAILTLDITNGGTFYESAPTVAVTRSVPPTGAAIDAVFTVTLRDCPPIDYEYCHAGDPPIVGQVELAHGDCYKECTTETRYDDKVQVITDAGDIDHFSHELTGIDCDCDSNCKWVEITNNTLDGITVYWQTCDSDGVEPGTSYAESIDVGGTWVPAACILCDTLRVEPEPVDPADVIITCTPCI